MCTLLLQRLLESFCKVDIMNETYREIKIFFKEHKISIPSYYYRRFEKQHVLALSIRLLLCLLLSLTIALLLEYPAISNVSYLYISILSGNLDLEIE